MPQADLAMGNPLCISFHHCVVDPISAVPEIQCSHFINGASGGDKGPEVADKVSTAVLYIDFTAEQYTIDLMIIKPLTWLEVPMNDNMQQQSSVKVLNAPLVIPCRNVCFC